MKAKVETLPRDGKIIGTKGRKSNQIISPPPTCPMPTQIHTFECNLDHSWIVEFQNISKNGKYCLSSCEFFYYIFFYRSANFGTNRNTKLRTGSKDYSQVATCASLSVRLTCTRRSSFECRVQPEVSWWSGRLFSELLRVRMADLSSRGHRQKGNNYPTNLVTCWWLWWDHPEGEKWSKFCWHYLDRPDLERSNYTTGMHTILHSSFILYTIFWPYYKCQNKE